MSIISDKRKGVITNIHRSDIFFQKQVDNVPMKIRNNQKSNIEFNLVDKPQSSKTTTKKEEFQPKYLNENDNAFKRRIKEVYGSEHYENNYCNEKLPLSSVGHIQTSKISNNTFDRKDFSQLSGKEKKILENCPGLTSEEVKQQIKKNEKLKNKEIMSKEHEVNQKKGVDSKSTLYSQLDSDIFNNKPKHKGNANNKANKDKEVKTENEKMPQQQSEKGINAFKKKLTNDSPWVSGLDWKDINGEVYFHKQYKK